MHHHLQLMSNGSRGAPARRSGVVLLAVLIVVAILMLVGYQFFNLMTAEFEAVHSYNRVSQSRAIADSGLHYAMFLLAYPQSGGLSDAEESTVLSPLAIMDNPSVFHMRPINAVMPRHQGYFSLLSPRDPDDSSASTGGFRFGVIDESGKINLLSLLQMDPSGSRAKEILSKLPNMPEDAPASILGWMQSQGTSETASSDSLFYASLGYSAKYGPYESVDELLLVRGITPRLLYGNDLNRNGLLDPEEDDGTGTLDLGLSRFLTIYGRELNTDSRGQPRIYVNGTDMTALYDDLNEVLGESLANFIAAYRIYGSASSSQNSGGSGDGNGGNSGNRGNGGNGVGNGGGRPGGGGPGGGGGGGPGGGMPGGGGDGGSPGGVSPRQAPGGNGGNQGQGGSGSGGTDASAVKYGELSKADIDFDKEPTAQVRSLFELIGAEVQITKEGEQSPTRYRSPLQRDDAQSLRDLLPLLLDHATTSQGNELPARININTAPQEVLATLPGITDADVQNILDHRPGPDMDPSQAMLYRTPAWLLTEAGFQPDVVQQLEPYVTTRSQVFRVQVVGYFDQGGPSARIEAVIDSNNGRPRLLFWRELTELGRGFDPRTFNTYRP